MEKKVIGQQETLKILYDKTALKQRNLPQSKKRNRQHNGQKKKDKRTNNDLQNIHIKSRSSNSNPIKNRGELRCSGRISSSVRSLS
jgi:hypothetical protein